MKKKSIWLVVSCLMVAVLVMTSCGPAVTEEEEEELVTEEAVSLPEEEPAEMPTGDETITFPDENLAAAVREALGKGPDDEITAAELGELRKLIADSRNIRDLTGIEYCANLTELELDGNKISDISPLASLASLTQVALGGILIRDISPLASLTSLTSVILWQNPLSTRSVDVYIPQLIERGVAVLW